MKPERALKHILSITPELKPFSSAPEWQIKSSGNVFNDLISCVIEQQIHYRSSKKTLHKALDRAGLKEVTIDKFAIFEKEGISEVKLSARKFETITHLVEFFKNNKIDFESLTETEIRSSLKQIKGIGDWSINMILIYTLGYKNIFDASDYQIKKAMKLIFQFEKPSDIKKFAEAWAPYKSIAFRILVGV